MNSPEAAARASTSRPGMVEDGTAVKADRQRPLRHDDDPVQGAEGRDDHQRPVGGRRHQRRPELRWHREPRRRARPRRQLPARGGPVGGHNYVVYSGRTTKKAEAAAAFIAFMSSA